MKKIKAKLLSHRSETTVSRGRTLCRASNGSWSSLSRWRSLAYNGLLQLLSMSLAYKAPSNTFNMENIIHGSNNQNDSNLKLTLERVFWNDERHFDVLLSWSHPDPSAGIWVTDNLCVIKICRSRSKRRSSFQQTRSKVSLKIRSMFSIAI